MKNSNQCTVYYYTFHAPITSHAIQKKTALQMLRHAFQSFFNTTLQKELIKCAPCGKPYYQSPGDYFFNISHSAAAVAVAVAHTPVGVDTESIRPIKPGIIKKSCSHSEISYIYGTYPPQNQQENLSPEQAKRFLNLWTLKESYVKMTGEGLRSPLNAICFDIPKFQKISPNTLQFINPNQYCSYLHTQPNCTISLTLQQKPSTVAPQIQWIPYSPSSQTNSIE